MAPDESRTERVAVRVRPGERRELERLAAEAGTTISGYIRASVAEPRERRTETVDVRLFDWELELIERAAVRSGCSVAEWLRAVGAECAEMVLQQEESL